MENKKSNQSINKTNPNKKLKTETNDIKNISEKIKQQFNFNKKDS